MSITSTKPELAWIAVDKCRVDRTYQRSVEGRSSKALIVRIADHFDWAAFGAVLVCRVKDGFEVIDGQHRLEVAKAKNIDKVPAVIVKGDTAQIRALVFVAANRDRLSLTSMALHRARVTAGDKTACAAQEAVDAAGIKIAPYPIPGDKIPAKMTLAVGTVSGCVKKFGPEITTSALKLVAQHWPMAGGIRAERIRGVAMAVSDYGADVIGTKMTAALCDDAADLAADEGEPRYAAIWKALIDAVRAKAAPVAKVRAA